MSGHGHNEMREICEVKPMVEDAVRRELAMCANSALLAGRASGAISIRSETRNGPANSPFSVIGL